MTEEKDVNVSAEDVTEEEMEIGYVTLVDEDGNEEEFEVLDMFELDNVEYVVIAPVADVDSDDALIFRLSYNEETGEEILSDIEDDAEWDKVAAEYMKLMEED